LRRDDSLERACNPLHKFKEVVRMIKANTLASHFEGFTVNIGFIGLNFKGGSPS